MRSRSLWRLACRLALALLLWPRQALAEPRAPTGSLAVRVVDVSDERAYLEPGSEAGIAVGDEVMLGGARYTVISVSKSFAMVSLQGRAVALGTRGTAKIVRPGERVELRPEPPAPLTAFRGEWRPAATPAAAQSPPAVPLGGRTSARREANRASLSDAVYAVVPRTSDPAFVGNEVRARLHYEPYQDLPLALDADAALRTFWGDDFGERPGAAARQLLRLRELTLTYGTAASFRGSLGRLRAAASMSGQLDGLRLEAPLTPELRLATYGGVVPHAFNGMLSTEVARFGADLTYDDGGSPLRPRAVAGVYASRFDGSLDEKKAFASIDLLPGHTRLGASAQFSFFEPDNPWRASAVELTAAGVDADVELGLFHVGGRASLQRPERSRWLATLLPREWLCWAPPARASAPCSSDDAVYSWVIDGGIRAGKLTVDLGGQSVFTRGTDASNFGGFAHLRWLDVIGRLHLDGNISVASGSVLRSAAITLAPGIAFADGQGDLSLRYRPAVVRYRAALESDVEHAVGGALWLAPSDSFDVDLECDWVRGGELDAFLLQAVASFNLGF